MFVEGWEFTNLSRCRIKTPSFQKAKQNKTTKKELEYLYAAHITYKLG